MNVLIRVNGRGNAWPLELGASENARDDQRRGRLEEYANTSLSILGFADASFRAIKWQVLFDIGQGVVPFLISNGNRLPDAVILSHPHFDHIAGLDWLVSSHGRHRSTDAPLPLYTSKPCWDEVIRRFSWLQSGLGFRELRPGEYCHINQAPDLWIKPYPVFHGDYAPGAFLSLVEYRPPSGPVVRAILTGDLLCPLLRQHDFDDLLDAAVMYVDTNTCFPCPGSGHWSLIGDAPASSPNSRILDDWIAVHDRRYLCTPHSTAFDPVTTDFLAAFFSDTGQLCWTIRDFVDHVRPNSVQLVHYSGYEDQKYHEQHIVNDDALFQWVKANRRFDIGSCSWAIPKPADTFVLHYDHDA